MWIRHSSASCLCLCLCSCLVSLVLIAAEIACRQAIRLSLPKPQATPFQLPFSLSTFGACGRWQRAFLNGALNKLPTATKFANLPCSLSLCVVPFLPFSDSSDSSTFYPKSCTKCPTCMCVFVCVCVWLMPSAMLLKWTQICAKLSKLIFEI